MYEKRKMKNENIRKHKNEYFIFSRVKKDIAGGKCMAAGSSGGRRLGSLHHAAGARPAFVTVLFYHVY